MRYDDLQYYTHTNMLLKHFYDEHRSDCDKSYYKCNTHYLTEEMIKETDKRIEAERLTRYYMKQYQVDEIVPRSTVK